MSGYNRAMRRKAERDKAKAEKPKGDTKDWSAQQLSQMTGVRVQSLCEWLDARSIELRDELADAMTQLLWEAECYNASANMIIMLYAIKKTFGSLKTVQKGMDKLIANVNDAADYVDSIGVKAAYEEIMEEYGIKSLSFEDFDINLLFENKGMAMLASKKIKDRVNRKGTNK